MPKLKLLPWPKEVKQGKGAFRLEAGLPVLIGPGSDKEVNAAWSFADEVEIKTGLRLPVERMGKLDGIRPRVLLLLAGRDEKLYPPLRALARRLSKAPKKMRDQAYALDVRNDEIVAAAATPQGLYYAAQTLRQLVTLDRRVPRVSITDWPSYQHRGVMLDISRFRVPTLESLFERIERLASMKINVFQLYTEHTFAFRRHPLIGKDCGAMTAEDILTLDDFCKEHFIELNANLQSFGHHAHVLAIPRYNSLAEMHDRPWTLCPVDPRIYKLLDDMYAECLPAYSSRLFNASCDETWELGKGRSRKLAGRIGLGRLYLGHIKRINQLARKYGKRMMIWADIVLQHPECIPDIPKDIVMLDWGYSAGAKLDGLRKLKAAGLEHWTCPGISTWRQIFANGENACGNIAGRAVAGLTSGATGLLNTDWGDDGHAQMPSASCHGYAWGAEQSWSPSVTTDGADFDRRFAWTWFRDEFGLFGELYRTTGRMSNGTRTNPGIRPFDIYWDRFPCERTLKTATPAAMKTLGAQVHRTLDLIHRLVLLHPEHHDVLAEFLFGASQTTLAWRKVAVSREILGLRAQGVKRLPPALRKKVLALLRDWTEQRAEFEDLWLRTSRPSEIAYRLGLYRKRAADYHRALR